MSSAVNGGTGLVLGLTTTVVNVVGHNLDVATGSATPTADSGPVTSVIINPDAVLRLLVVKGATGGQLDILTESVGGSKIANTITTGETAPNSPSQDEGLIVCIAGANKGQTRKITSVSATVATNIEGWVNNNAVGDVFIMVPFAAGGDDANNHNLTTDLASVRADITAGTGADMRAIELIVPSASITEARNFTYSLAMFDDTLQKGAGT